MQAPAEGVHRGVLHQLLHVPQALRRARRLAVGNECRDGVGSSEAVLRLLASIINTSKIEEAKFFPCGTGGGGVVVRREDGWGENGLCS